MYSKKILCSALLAISLLLSACGGGAQADTTPTPDSQSVLTAAAVTAQARMTELAGQTPSPLPATATYTPAPATPTATRPTTLVAATTGAPPVSSGSDRLEFVADLTVPDGTTFAAGEKFTKTWRLRNSGTSTWTTAYALVYSYGDQMGGVASTPLPVQVPPGQTVDLSVQLTAPSSAGNYAGFWLLRNPAGTNFGLGPNANGAFYVQISVSTTAATSTTGPSPTPGSTSGSAVTSATLSVNQATVSAACPYTFTFTGAFTLSRAATVVYQLDVEADVPLNLPGPTTASLNAGTSQVTYTLNFTASTSGNARLHITSPEDVSSTAVNFTLTCQ